MRGEVGFAFPQQMNPDLASGDGCPRFIDYLYLALAKVPMMVQSLISLAILDLVIARIGRVAEEVRVVLGPAVQ